MSRRMEEQAASSSGSSGGRARTAATLRRPVQEKFEAPGLKGTTPHLAFCLLQVRFSPNLCCHTWVVSGGRTGLVRLHCLRGMFSTLGTMSGESKAPFHTLCPLQEPQVTLETAEA